MTKECKKCKEFKELDLFSKNRTNEDGLQDNCKACNKEYRNSPKTQIRNKEYRDTPESKEYQREYNQDPDYREQERKRDQKPERKKRRIELRKLDMKNNPGKYNARAAKRRAKKLQRTPKWLTKEQLEEIRDMYLLCDELQWLSEEPLEVDHIIPLQGKNVSGLHVPWNLQILPRSANRSKGFKLIQK